MPPKKPAARKYYFKELNGELRDMVNVYYTLAEEQARRDRLVKKGRAESHLKHAYEEARKEEEKNGPVIEWGTWKLNEDRLNRMAELTRRIREHEAAMNDTVQAVGELRQTIPLNTRIRKVKTFVKGGGKKAVKK